MQKCTMTVPTGDTDSVGEREALRRAVLGADRAQSVSEEDPEDVLESWRALLKGRWSLVDSFDHEGRRYVMARRNDATPVSPSGLSERERQIAAFAALGYTNKHIAYTLGLAPSTVSSHLRSAMRRLGVRDAASLAPLFFGPHDEDHR